MRRFFPFSSTRDILSMVVPIVGRPPEVIDPSLLQHREIPAHHLAKADQVIDHLAIDKRE